MVDWRPVEQFSVTRTDLLACRAQIGLARLGRDLLEEKRNQLLREFRRSAEAVLAGSDELEQAAVDARRALAETEACDGPEQVRSAALAASGEIAVEATTTRVMGVAVPEVTYRPVQRAPTGRGYSLSGTSPGIDWVAERFERELDLVLGVAASELRARRLAAEVGRTTRRVNGLEHVVIPRLEGTRDAIAMALDERERHDRFRLKRVKARTQARGARR